MNADETARFPGLAAERTLLAEAVDADVPVLAVCLGMQLLARALGAPVHRGHGTEIGFAPVQVVGDEPVLAPIDGAPVLHWHSDAAELPGGATLLASTPTTPVQAFRAGSALGLQFHLEMTPGLLRDWLAEPAMLADLDRHGVVGLESQAGAHLALLRPRAVLGLDAFAVAVRDRG